MNLKQATAENKLAQYWEGSQGFSEDLEEALDDVQAKSDELLRKPVTSAPAQHFTRLLFAIMRSQ